MNADVTAAVTSALIAAVSLPVSIWSARTAKRATRATEDAVREARMLRQEQLGYSGGDYCINYRNQVLQLSDRGLSIEQIRRMLYLEDDFASTERDCGSIDDILSAAEITQTGRPIPQQGVPDTSS